MQMDDVTTAVCECVFLHMRTVARLTGQLLWCWHLTFVYMKLRWYVVNFVWSLRS